MAAPFGPPPHVPTAASWPSAVTRVTRPASISVTKTLPSAHATGPSGNDRRSASPVTSSRTTAVMAAPVGATSGLRNDAHVHRLVLTDEGPQALLGPRDRVGIAGKGLEGPAR